MANCFVHHVTMYSLLSFRVAGWFDEPPVNDTVVLWPDRAFLNQDFVCNLEQIQSKLSKTVNL
jgi:hypothetical protein